MLFNLFNLSIAQLAFQAVVAQNLIEDNDYKVHDLEVTNELTRKTIDDIWEVINGGIGGDIVERTDVLEDKTQNINHNGDTTSIANTLDVNHVTCLYAEDVIYKIPSIILLGGDNGLNNNYGMYAPQSWSNLDLLLAGDDINLLSTVNDYVKKINFSTTSCNSPGLITLIFATRRVNNNQYTQTDTSSILTTVSPLAIHEFDVNFKINIGDQVFVGYNSGTIAFTFNLAETDTNPSSSYYFSILRTFSNVDRTY
jgi:hypothetical protein